MIKTYSLLAIVSTIWLAIFIQRSDSFGPPPRAVPLNGRCNTTAQCKQLDQYTNCTLIRQPPYGVYGKCHCNSGLSVVNGRCGVPLLGYCQNDSVCDNVVDHSSCQRFLGPPTCRCKTGYESRVAQPNQCVRISQTTNRRRLHDRCNNTAQCAKADDYSNCFNGFCVCQRNYTEIKGRCGVPINGTCYNDKVCWNVISHSICQQVGVKRVCRCERNYKYNAARRVCSGALSNLRNYLQPIVLLFFTAIVNVIAPVAFSIK